MKNTLSYQKGETSSGIFGRNILGVIFNISVTLGIIIPLSSCANLQNQIKSKINITMKDSGIKGNKIPNFELQKLSSLSSLSENEKLFFIEFFNLNSLDKNSISEKIKNLQNEFNITESGIICPKTLELIYINYYSKSNNLSHEIKKRLEIYLEMQKYKSFNSKAKTGKLDVFKDQTFFGPYENIPNTYIDSESEKFIDKSIEKMSKEKNIIKFINIGGKTILLMYINHNLHIATHVSAGSLNTKTKSFYKVGDRNPNKYYSSKTYGNSVMPYAIHISGGYFIHGSDGIINGLPASHGCIRVGLYYIKEIFEQFEKIGIENIIIDTSGIYAIKNTNT